MAERAARFVTAGLCRKCGKVPCPNGGRCRDCKKKTNDWEARNRERRAKLDPNYKPRDGWTVDAKRAEFRLEVLLEVQRVLATKSQRSVVNWVNRELGKALALATGFGISLPKELAA